MLAIVPMPTLDTLSCQATEPQLRSVTLHYATALSVASRIGPACGLDVLALGPSTSVNLLLTKRASISPVFYDFILMDRYSRGSVTEATVNQNTKETARYIMPSKADAERNAGTARCHADTALNNPSAARRIK